MVMYSNGSTPRNPDHERIYTYKVLIEINGVKTCALLDHDTQVSLARKELLPLIKENKWSIDQCEARNLKMSGQPIGAGGEALEATAWT